MRVIDVLLSPWAIIPEKYREILAIYDRWVRGEKADIPAIEAAIGRPLQNGQVRYTVENGVAIIPIYGVIGKRMSMFSQISGGASTQAILTDFKEALGRKDVKAILFDIDSPGGTVDGTVELARAIFAARGQKAMATLGDGCIASAAIWIGAAADNVYLASDTTVAGSIGIVADHADYSKAEEKAGVKITVLSAGKYKALGNEHEPLSKEAEDTIRARLDYTYSLFVDDIVKFRGSDAETVLAEMADGRVFIGQQAVDAGLVDGIMSREELIQRLSGNAGQSAVSTPGGTARKTGGVMNEVTIEALRAEHPEIVEAILTEGRQAGATAERERIQSVFAQSMRGHEALIQQLAFDGKTTGPEAAVQVLGAERAANEKRAENLATMSPPPAKPSMPVPETGTKEPKADGEQETVNALLGITSERFEKFASVK